MRERQRVTTGRLLGLLAGLALIISVNQASAQESPRFLYEYNMPPGQIGGTQLLRRPAMPGYYQPVQLIGPAGSRISVFVDGVFQDLGSSKVTVGMLLGETYRVKVTQLPGRPGVEVFPSIEVINRLYPPPGLELKFPVQVHLAEEDLASAANGAIVTRVVYLEHPEEALPTAQNRHEQPYFDVSTHRDPLRVAQQLGRPMAIARCGSRIPDEFELPSFTFGGPPLQLYAVFDDAAVRPSPEQSAGVAASPPDQKN